MEANRTPGQGGATGAAGALGVGTPALCLAALIREVVVAAVQGGPTGMALRASAGDDGDGGGPSQPASPRHPSPDRQRPRHADHTDNMHPVRPEQPDDTALLLERLLEGETAAWRELVARYSGFMLAVARRTFAGYGAKPQRHDCEDAVAEVWKNLVENDRRLLRECLARASLLPTLQVLCRHRSIDILRRRRATLSLADGQAEDHLAQQPPRQDLPLEALRAAMGGLTPRERTLVNLFFLQGRKYREIAVLTGIPQNSIGPTLNRALGRLREALRDE